MGDLKSTVSDKFFSSLKTSYSFLECLEKIFVVVLFILRSKYMSLFKVTEFTTVCVAKGLYNCLTDMVLKVWSETILGKGTTSLLRKICNARKKSIFKRFFSKIKIKRRGLLHLEFHLTPLGAYPLVNGKEVSQCCKI